MLPGHGLHETRIGAATPAIVGVCSEQRGACKKPAGTLDSAAEAGAGRKGESDRGAMGCENHSSPRRVVRNC